MCGIATIITSLLIVCVVSQEEVKLISELNKFFNFDHNIFLLDSSVDRNQFIQDQNFVPQTVYALDGNIEDDNATELPMEINSKNTFMIVVPAWKDFETNLNLLNRMQKMQQLQIDMKIGIFFTQYLPREDPSLEILFKWCKEQLIVNIFATYPHSEVSYGSDHTARLLNIFTFDPFGVFGVIDVTGSATVNSFFRSLASNFQQYQLKLGEPFDSEDEFWPTILGRMNASYTVIEHNFSKQSEYFENGIHIVPGLRAQLTLIDFSLYTLETEYMSVVVPASVPYSDFSAYLQNITSNDLLGFFMITIAASVAFLTMFRYIKRKQILFFQSMSDVMNLILNDNGCIKYQRLYYAEVFTVVPLTFAGFIIVNLILSMLLGHLTRPVDKPQINSLEELYRSPFQILVVTKRPKSLAVSVFTDVSKGENWNWNAKINLTTHPLDDQFEAYDRSTSYFVTASYADLVLRVQKRLNIKGYHDPHIQPVMVYRSSPIDKKFLFLKRLNELNHRIKSAGLYDEWRRRVSARKESQILEMNRQRFSDSERHFENNFEFPTFIFYGWTVSAIVLVIEIVWERSKPRG